MLMSPLNGVNKELTGRVSLCAARAGGVMAMVSVCNYTLSRCILAAVVGEQAAQSHTREKGEGEREKSLCFSLVSGSIPRSLRLFHAAGFLGLAGSVEMPPCVCSKAQAG